MPLPAEEFKVFISHAAKEDGNLVNWMADALDRIHIRAFVYERYQMGGRNRFELIKTLIKECPYFLVVLTRDGIQSQWVNQEIGYAVGMNKNLIPIAEVDTFSGRRLESKGFVELHDSINYVKNNRIGLMADVIYTLTNYLAFEGKWRDLVFLSCGCGLEFEGKLEFNKWWERWLHDSARGPFTVEWPCQACNRIIRISFPDCHLLS